LDGIASEWGVIIQRLEETEKLPIYTVTLNDENRKFSHMINAVLLDQDHPEKLESYIFIEPQSDAVMLTAEDVYNHYLGYFNVSEAHEKLNMSIGKFDSYKFNGNIYQSWGNQLYKFEL
jgi:nitrogenase molybdenum-iron protein alpha/beta subunit